MAMVAVYRYTVWDQSVGGQVSVRRMGTREAIRSITGSVVIEASAMDIDEAVLGREEPGMTDWDFNLSQ
jgi:hypothetical protein